MQLHGEGDGNTSSTIHLQTFQWQALWAFCVIFCQLLLMWAIQKAVISTPIEKRTKNVRSKMAFSCFHSPAAIKWSAISDSTARFPWFCVSPLESVFVYDPTSGFCMKSSRLAKQIRPRTPRKHYDLNFIQFIQVNQGLTWRMKPGRGFLWLWLETFETMTTKTTAKALSDMLTMKSWPEMKNCMAEEAVVTRHTDVRDHWIGMRNHGFKFSKRQDVSDQQ